MRRVLICTGVLGGGTAVTFAAAALAATMLPGGTIVPSSMFTNSVVAKGGPAIIQSVPVPQIIVDDGSSGTPGGIDGGLTPEPTPSD